MEPHPEVPDLVFTANAGLVNGVDRRESASSCPATSATPSASPRRRSTPPGSPAGAGGSTALPEDARPRGRGRRPAVHARRRADGAAVGLLVPLRRLGRHRAVAAAGLPGAPGAARRPAAVPPRPDVLPARRPPGDRRPARLGRLRPQGGRGAGARAAGAHRRRGAVVLRQLGGGRPHGRDAGHAARGWAASSRPGASTWSSAASTSSSRRAGGCRCLTLALDTVLGGSADRAVALVAGTVAGRRGSSTRAGASRQASADSTIDTTARTVWTTLNPTSWSAARMLDVAHDPHRRSTRRPVRPRRRARARAEPRHRATTTPTASSVKLSASAVRPTFSPGVEVGVAPDVGDAGGPDEERPGHQGEGERAAAHGRQGRDGVSRRTANSESSTGVSAASSPRGNGPGAMGGPSAAGSPPSGSRSSASAWRRAASMPSSRSSSRSCMASGFSLTSARWSWRRSTGC